MNTEAFWIIALGIWIFTLQSKIKRLEQIVTELLAKEKKTTPKTVTHKEKTTSIKTKPVEVERKVTAIEKVKEPEYVSAVTTLKTEHTSPKATTRVLKPKEEHVHTEPSWLMSMLTNYFTGGNLLVRIGGVILFFGLAFLVKYAAEHSIISIEMRLWGIGFAAVALIATGWKLRDREGAYGQILQGLGVAMLYLVIYGASKFYGLLSLEMAFSLMLGVVVLGSMLAVIEDSLPLALFATAGGFLVPILTSNGDGSHVTLFSYYAFLNLGLFIVAWFRSWRVLNVVGFLFTFVISTAWGVLRYKSGLFSSTEPFLILYFFMYLSISILFTIKHPYEPKNLVDGTLVFGLPVIAFPLQVSLVSVFEYGEAYSAVALGMLYAGLWFWLKNKERTNLLAQSFLALSVVFFTIAVPYIFDADVSAALWSLESAGIVWIALKQNKVITRYFGQALLFLSVFVYPSSVAPLGITVAEYLGYLVLIISVLVTSYLLDMHRPKLFEFDRLYSKALLVIAGILWFMSTPSQMMRFDIVYVDALLYALILFVLLSFIVIRYSQWKMLICAQQVYFPLGMVFTTLSLWGMSHPFAGLGAFTVGLFIAFGYFLLYSHHKVWQYAKQMHSLMLWFIVVILALEVRYHTHLLVMGESIVLVKYLAYLILVVAVFVAGYFLEKYVDVLGTLDKYTAKIFLALSLLLWFTSTTGQLLRFEILNHYEMLLSFVTGTVLLFVVSKRLPWAVLPKVLQGYFPLGTVLVGIAVLQVPHPFVGLGVGILGIFFVLHYVLLYHYDKVWNNTKYLHIVTPWVLVFIGILELKYQANLLHLSEGLMSVAVVLSPLVCAILLLVPKRYGKWLETYRVSYQLVASAGLMVFLVLWTVKTFAVESPYSGAYIPLFNPLDLTQALVLWVMGYWVAKHKSTFTQNTRMQLYGGIVSLIAIFITVVYARAIHIFRDVNYALSSLWQDAYFQTGLSILWSIIAIVLMLLSKRYSKRPLWLAGFGLLIVVVLKLFFVELVNSGTIERIVSFMVVGVLLLLIGYFVPMPPNKEAEE